MVDGFVAQSNMFSMEANMIRYIMEQQDITVLDWFPPQQSVQPGGGDEHMEGPHDEESGDE
ncbi:hypothetical protein Hanom_Chr16g01518151 [Helianthus anomalus]